MQRRFHNAAKILSSEKLLSDAVQYLVGTDNKVSASAESYFVKDDDIATVLALAASKLPLFYVPEAVADQAIRGLSKLAASEAPICEALFEKASKILARMTYEEAIQTLGIDPGEAGDPKAVKKAHRNAALQNHPDRGGSKEAMQRVNEAYELLKRGGVSTPRGGGDGSWWQEARKQDAIAYKAFIKQLDRTIKVDTFTDYFDKTIGKKFTARTEPNETNGSYKVLWESSDGETFLELYISSGQPTYRKTLGGPNDANFSLPVYMQTRILHNNRKAKMANKDWTFDGSMAHVTDPQKLFPAAKLKKMVAGKEKKRKFSKRDMKLGIEKALGGSYYKDEATIPLGPDGAEFWMYRTTMLGQAAWHAGSILLPRVPKQRREKIRLPVQTFMETEDLLQALRDVQKKLSKETDTDKIRKELLKALNKVDIAHQS